MNKSFFFPTLMRRTSDSGGFGLEQSGGGTDRKTPFSIEPVLLTRLKRIYIAKKLLPLTSYFSAKITTRKGSFLLSEDTELILPYLVWFGSIISVFPKFFWFFVVHVRCNAASAEPIGCRDANRMPVFQQETLRSVSVSQNDWIWWLEAFYSGVSVFRCDQRAKVMK